MPIARLASRRALGAVVQLNRTRAGNMPLQMDALNNTEWCKRYMAGCHESNCLPEPA